MLFNSICIKDMIGSCRSGFNPQYRQHFSVGIFQDLSTLTHFNWIVSMVKRIWWIHIQLRIAAVGQSPSGLWYTCVHAKQLLIDPMYMWVEKRYSLFLRQCKVYQQARSQWKKGAKKKSVVHFIQNNGPSFKRPPYSKVFRSSELIGWNLSWKYVCDKDKT